MNPALNTVQVSWIAHGCTYLLSFLVLFFSINKPEHTVTNIAAVFSYILPHQAETRQATDLPETPVIMWIQFLRL